LNQTIQKLLDGKEDSHVLPFFWQHGESEEVLREMMAAIAGANCREVCIESRPHPDFCGPGWWHDMDILLDEAQRRNMRIWILDDAHFPTGYANGALKNADPSLCKQEIFLSTKQLDSAAGLVALDLAESGLTEPPKQEIDPKIAQYLAGLKPARVFDDDEILGVSMQLETGETIDLAGSLSGTRLSFEKPAGAAELRVLVKSRNAGMRRDYISLISPDSVRVLIDAVYEPHWEHYSKYFGNTIAGFFSDEPELGNGFLYEKNARPGRQIDYPWSKELEAAVAGGLGKDWKMQLPRLFMSDASDETSRVHSVYMNALTGLVRQAFSEQIGDWCRAHGVSYIGHMIEDDGAHTRTGCSLGHYFRGLAGQDMAGIDDIGGQVLPQGEDEPKMTNMRQPRDGRFFHYGLAALAESAAAIDPRKQGRSLCEIFGNYGWEEGVSLEKYLADFFLVRGINHFVPHAFTGKTFPDPDCPPHFYAHGHNPQYRHFGCLVRYMNRVSTLTESGTHEVPAAILYHAESEWCGETEPFEAPLRALYDQQICAHTIPADVFENPEYFHAELKTEGGRPVLRVGTQSYRAFIVPAASRIPKAAADGIVKLMHFGLPVFFCGRIPDGLCEGGRLPDEIRALTPVDMAQLPEAVRAAAGPLISIAPASDRIRVLSVSGDTPLLMVTNEGRKEYSGTLMVPGAHLPCYAYDAWENVCRPVQVKETSDGVQIRLKSEPGHSLIFVFGDADAPLVPEAVRQEEIALPTFVRSCCEAAAYPDFEGAKSVALPDNVAEEMEDFSGFVRYEADFTLPDERDLLLVIGQNCEGIEVFLNDKSAGLQIAAPYRFRLHGVKGVNHLAIEVATTLERECYPMLTGYRKLLARKPAGTTGLASEVHLYTL
jgi:hypothetical protein